jgi:outer membrane protein assembly factor BamD
MMVLNKKYIVILLCCIGLFACNSEKKIYESDREVKSKKTKKSKFALTKYNKLLKSDDSEAKYAAAVKYFDKKSYTKSTELLEDIIPVYKGTPKETDVQYYYAYSSYNVGDYIVAGYQFRSFAKKFPDSKYTEECAYMGALCYFNLSPVYSLDQEDTEKAINEMQRFVNSYPKSSYVAESNNKLDILRAKLEQKSYESAILYYKMENYKAAVVAFDNHLKDFPETKRVEELNFLTLKSQYLLAKNSVEAKKSERFKGVIDSYIKFAQKFPNSVYLKEAEKFHSDALNYFGKA